MTTNYSSENCTDNWFTVY